MPKTHVSHVCIQHGLLFLASVYMCPRLVHLDRVSLHRRLTCHVSVTLRYVLLVSYGTE